VVSHGEELLAPRPSPKLEDHPLSAVRDCFIEYIRSYPPYLEAAPFHRHLMTRHAVVKGAHIRRVMFQNGTPPPSESEPPKLEITALLRTDTDKLWAAARMNSVYQQQYQYQYQYHRISSPME
jgi:hypothetical protein